MELHFYYTDVDGIYVPGNPDARRVLKIIGASDIRGITPYQKGLFQELGFSFWVRSEGTAMSQAKEF